MFFYWNVILITCGAELDLHTRSMRQDFNESLVLAMIMYFHCVSLVLIIIARQLNSVYSEYVIEAAISFILSLHTMTKLAVYFVPNFLAASKYTLRTPNITSEVSHGSLR